MNPQSLNLYIYALNNPLRYVDRDGLESDDNIIVRRPGQKWHEAVGRKLPKPKDSSRPKPSSKPDRPERRDDIIIKPGANWRTMQTSEITPSPTTTDPNSGNTPPSCSEKWLIAPQHVWAQVGYACSAAGMILIVAGLAKLIPDPILVPAGVVIGGFGFICDTMVWVTDLYGACPGPGPDLSGPRIK